MNSHSIYKFIKSLIYLSLRPTIYFYFSSSVKSAHQYLICIPINRKKSQHFNFTNFIILYCYITFLYQLLSEKECSLSSILLHQYSAEKFLLHIDYSLFLHRIISMCRVKDTDHICRKYVLSKKSKRFLRNSETKGRKSHKQCGINGNLRLK